GDPSESTIDRSETPTLPPYRVVRRVGSGGMGEVFLAHDDRLGRKVAIKCLRPDREATAASRERLRREARFVARLSHPAIVQVHDVLERDGADYLVMEWVDGEDLRRLSRHERPMSVEQIVALARQLAGGLAEAHRRGVVHRDLKAENVLVDAHGRAKITDFGIAKRMPGGSGSSVALDDALTADEVVLGTYRSMSPEQALAEPVGPRSDLFSLGVLLYELLADRSPFEGTSALDTLRRVVEMEPEPVEQLRPDTPAALAALIAQLLDKDPNRRPRGAAEVERTLASLDTSDDTLTSGTPRPSAVARRPGASPRSRRITIAALAVAALTVAALLSVREWSAERGASHVEAPIYVAALPPDVRPDGGSEAGGGGLTTFAEAVRVAMVRGLIALDGVSAKATAEIDRIDGSPLDIARSVGADEILSATVVYRPASARVSLGRLRVADGVVTTSTAFDVPTDDLLLTVRAVSAQVRGLYPVQNVRPDAPGLDVGPEALRRFIELRRTFLMRE
ncbi:MAG: serine/threonine-protein kinase, partial [Acidobacteriota bacterium]